MTELTQTHFVLYRHKAICCCKTLPKALAVSRLLLFLTQVVCAEPHCHKQCSLQRLCSVHADVPHFRQVAPSDAEDCIPHGFPPLPWH